MSEHTLEGRHYPLELHLVHQFEDKIAVVGILVDVASNENFNLFDRIPKIGESLDLKVDFNHLIPEDTSHYYYVGSLTTPPCSGSVKWVILDKHLKIPKAQLMKFKKFYFKNHRNIQNKKLHNIFHSI